MVLFNLIPKIILLLTTLLTMITGFMDLIAKLFADYIKRCIPEGDIITENSDGTQTLDNSLLDNFINSSLLDGTNSPSNNKPNTYGNYIHDKSEKQHRIYKPRIK